MCNFEAAEAHWIIFLLTCKVVKEYSVEVWKFDLAISTLIRVWNGRWNHHHYIQSHFSKIIRTPFSTQKSICPDWREKHFFVNSLPVIWLHHDNDPVVFFEKERRTLENYRTYRVTLWLRWNWWRSSPYLTCKRKKKNILFWVLKP